MVKIYVFSIKTYIQYLWVHRFLNNLYLYLFNQQNHLFQIIKIRPKPTDYQLKVGVVAEDQLLVMPMH